MDVRRQSGSLGQGYAVMWQMRNRQELRGSWRGRGDRGEEWREPIGSWEKLGRTQMGKKPRVTEVVSHGLVIVVVIILTSTSASP